MSKNMEKELKTENKNLSKWGIWIIILVLIGIMILAKYLLDLLGV